MIKVENIMKPFGRGFSAISMKTFVEDLARRYKNEIEETLDVQAFKEKDDYFVYTHIPSKSNPKYLDDFIEYDVVLQFTPPNSAWKTAQNIRDYDVRIFNNMPSFMFTFDYAYYHKNGLIKLPNGYYGHKAIKDAPKIRNPMLLLGIDEGSWFLITFMERHKMFDRDTIDRICEASDMTFKEMVKEIKTQDAKYTECVDRTKRHSKHAKDDRNSSWFKDSDKTKKRKAFLNSKVDKNDNNVETHDQIKDKDTDTDKIKPGLFSSLMANLKSKFSRKDNKEDNTMFGNIKSSNMKSNMRTNMKSFNMRSSMKSSL